MARCHASGVESVRKLCTSAAEGSRPVRSREARRSSVWRFSVGDRSRPCSASSDLRMASTGWGGSLGEWFGLRFAK